MNKRDCRIQLKGFRAEGSEDTLNVIKEKFTNLRNELSETEEYVSFFGKDDPMIDELFSNLQREKKKELETLKEEGIKLQNEVQYKQRLNKEYEKKGYGLSLIITVHSSLQLAYGAKDFEDRLSLIQKELCEGTR